jgi:hypothetical protein
MSDNPPKSPPPASPPPPAEKKAKERSPAYPAIGLRKALEYTQLLWGHDKRQATLTQRAAVNLGFSAKSSGGQLALAAMKKFGLLIEEGAGEGRKVKLSEAAIGLLNPSAPNRDQLLKEAALKPSIYADLWNKYGAGGASDGTIRDYLVFERKFFDEAVKILLSTFKDTISFANLGEGDKVEQATEIQKNDTYVPPNPGLEIAKELPKFEQRKGYTPTPGAFAPTQQVNPNELPIPLDGGLVARVPFPMSEDTFDLLLGTLQLWKKKLVRPEYPKQAIWKNKDSDVPVTITGVAGTHEGQLFYQSSTGTGIPASELEFQ